LNQCYKEKNKEKALDNFFNLIKGDKKYDGLFLRTGNMSRSLTYNSLTDLDVNEALDCLFSSQNEEMRFNYLSEVNNSAMSTEASKNNLSTLLSQNMEMKDEVLKIMMIGSNMIGKTALLSSFTDSSFDLNKYVYFPTLGMEIKKIFLKLNEKNVKIEFYDTDMNIHQKDITQTFYKICNAYFYIVDANRMDTFEYIRATHMKVLNSHTRNASFYLFVVRAEAKASKDVELIKDYCLNAKITFCRTNPDEFTQKNVTLLNYLNNVLIRKVSCKDKKSAKKIKTYNETRYNSNDMYLLETSLSPFSDYQMLESKEEGNNFVSRLKYNRKFSYNQKLPKNNC